MSTLITRRGTAALAVAGALLVAAFAAAPQADASTLYFCAKKKSGAVRLVSKSAKCKKSEKKLSWNTQGPAGANGVKGLNGVNGTNGKDGSPGKEGPAGPAKILSFSALPLLNSWTDTQGVYSTSPVGFATDGFGVVHLRGGVRGGTANPIGLLPVAVRPAHEIYAISWGFMAETPAFVRIDPSGEVNVFDQGGVITKVKSFASLEGVTFFTG